VQENSNGRTPSVRLIIVSVAEESGSAEFH
jgi:hypothetical protein